MKKVFYRQVIKEWLTESGDQAYVNQRHEGKIEYGVLPPNHSETFTSYTKLIGAIRQYRKDKSYITSDLSVTKHFGKEVIYSGSKGWVEEGMYAAGLIKEKNFKQYVIEYTYEEVSPTIKDFVTNIPYELVKEYVSDHPEDKLLDVESWIKAFKK